MAGKVQLAKFGHQYNNNNTKYDINDAPYIEHSPPSTGWNMEEDVVLDQLSDQSFKKRAEILEYLIISARRNGGRLPYSDVFSIFQGLDLALADSNWDVRLKCIQLINETVPQLGDDLDSCMSLVLSRLVPNLGDSKITIRKAVIQTLHVYMKYTRNIQALLRAIVKSGLDSDDSRVRKEAMVSLPMLFTPEFANENFFEVTMSLAKKLLDTSVEDNLRETALFTMEKIRNFVGDRSFNGYLQKLSPPLRHYYMQLANRTDENGFSNQTNTKASDSPILSARSHAPLSSRRQISTDSDDSYEFGIIPSHTMHQIYDQENFKARALAVEEMKNIVGDLFRLDLLKPHMLSFISFISNLLDDANFKITTVTLEILDLLAGKLGQDVRQYLKPLTSALTKRMSDNKIVVRQAIMRVAMQLMQSYSPKPVLSVICENLTHRNSKVRQETINIIIASLLKFPSYDFDLPRLCQNVGPSLLDPKRQVRQAALECFAVLAQAMGTGKLGPLVQAVDQVELNSIEGEGVMAAVQARLARRQLPKVTVDGLIESATPINTGSQRAGMLQGADIDWIMAAASGGTGSARTSRSEMAELESVSSRTSSAVSREGSARPIPAPRRFMSAGRGRNKLPWEEEKDERTKPYDSMPGTAPAQTNRHPNWRQGVRSNQTNDAPPLQPRMTWGGEESIQDGKRGPKTSEDSPTVSQRGKVKRQNSLRQSNYDDDNGYRESSWETTSSVASHRHNKTKLEPIPGKDLADDTPIPLKPTLARGSATQRSKVPPIIPSSDKYYTPRDDDRDSAYAPSLGSTADTESQAEMMHSLRQIRNSASKKKAAKIFEKLEKQSSVTSRSPSPPLSDFLMESGFYSSSKEDWSDWPSRESSRKGGKRSEAPFEAKPRLARAGSLKEKKSYTQADHDERVIKPNHQLEFNPMGGVTFRNNQNSDVQIVGRGYGEDSSSLDSKPSSILNNKARDRRRLTKGMFDTSGLSDQAVNSSSPLDRPDRKHMRQAKNYPTGIYGIGVRQNSSDKPDTGSSGDEWDDVEDDVYNISMSKTTRERMAQKKQQRQEEVDKKRKDKEEKLLLKEKEKQQERLRQLSDVESPGESLAISGSSSSGPAKSSSSPAKPPPAISPRKKSKPGLQSQGSTERPPIPISASTKSVVTSENPEDWEPFRDPEAALREAQKCMTQQDWETKCNGINIVRRLSMYHPDVLIAQLHPIVIALIAEVKNLRSQVSRLAVVCFGDMFEHLKKNMDTDLDMTIRALLAKNGESNGFIRDDVDRALSLMVDTSTPQRALLALVAGGATHKNAAVRKTASYFLVTVVDRMGPGRILSGVKDITDRILPTAAQFTMDSSPETRYNGRKIFFMLMTHQDFDKMLSKHLPANTNRNILDIVENLKLKGLGDIPSETMSARSRRSGQGSRSSSFRGGSAASSMSGPSDPAKRRVLRTDEHAQDEIKEIIAKLAASDWRERYKGITQFLEMSENNTNVVGTHLVKIFDKFLPRLQDSNSKVNLYALQVMLQIVPILKDWLSSVVNMTVQNVAPNLNSKNKEIYQMAMTILDILLEHIDGSMLVQPFSNQAQSASSRSKPDLVEKVAYLVSKVYPRKQKQVVLHVLPLLWHLLGVNNSAANLSGNSPLRTATVNLVHSLYNNMGQGLTEHASSNPAISAKHIQLLQELIDQ